MPLTCRYYKQKFPELEDVVMVNVCKIGEMGAYVHLLEYNNIEGMILLSELSRRRIRSINKLVRVGRTESVVVIRVDKDKGYVDLSKRRVTPEDIIKCEEKYAKAKAIQSILRHVAELMNYDEEQFEQLYTKTAWYFNENMGNPTAAFDAFKLCVNNPALLDGCKLDQKVKDFLMADIRRRLIPPPVKVRTEFEICCYSYEGVDGIKNALRAGLACATEEISVKINLIASPRYVMTCVTVDKEKGINLLNEALLQIQESIKKSAGHLTVTVQPKLVADLDEANLAKQMKQAELENKEVSGDDNSEDAGDEEHFFE